MLTNLLLPLLFYLDPEDLAAIAKGFALKFKKKMILIYLLRVPIKSKYFKIITSFS